MQTTRLFFYGVESQQRGSLYIHVLTWIQGFPKYGKNDDTENYVDRGATCSADVQNDFKNILDF